MEMYSLLIPNRQQVFLDELQDGVQPHPETEGLPWNILLEQRANIQYLDDDGDEI